MLIKYIIEDSVINPIYLIGTLKGKDSVDWGFFRENDGLRLIYLCSSSFEHLNVGIFFRSFETL